MVRGRKPKPIAQKRWEGNPGKGHLRAELEVRGKLPASAPESLGRIGAALWRRLLREMAPGVWKSIDRELLEAYCLNYELLRAARRELTARGGALVLENSRGTFGSNPLVAQIRLASAQMARLGAELGLTPAARARLENAGVAEMIEDDFFDDGKVIPIGN